MAGRVGATGSRQGGSLLAGGVDWLHRVKVIGRGGQTLEN